MAKNKVINKLTTDADGYNYPSYLVQRISMLLGTFITALLGITSRGDCLLILVHLNKQYGWHLESYLPDSPLETQTNKTDHNDTTASLSSGSPPFSSYFANFHWLFSVNIIYTFLTYYSLGGYLQNYYYVKRKDQAQEWKCQPNRWLTPANERHEILMGSFNMFLGATYGTCVVAYIINGGPLSKMYFDPLERGWLYLIASPLILFFFHDGMAYYAHRLHHIPLIYKHIHKHHHRYHTPTAFSATAMHPAEFLVFNTIVVIPIFFLPVYSGIYIFVVIYQYYYGMMDHSGVKMDALWPWQPPTMFHDNHHKYFHVNFGFNMSIWDRMHDTLHRPDRIYGEDIFYGRGKQPNKTS